MVRSGQVTVNTTGGVTSGLAGGPAAEALLLSRKTGMWAANVFKIFEVGSMSKKCLMSLLQCEIF